MTQQEKDSIREALRIYSAKYSSQKKAAASLGGVSAGTLSAVINGRYENISDDMFRNIIAQITPAASAMGWQIVETGPFQEIWYALRDAQEFKKVRWIVGGAGCGKTTTATMYAQKHHEVFVILCDEDMRKGDFVREIARRLGFKTCGMRVREILDLAIESLIQMESPLLVFDEGDKLNDSVFQYFINLYNRLEGKCGITFLSTGYIRHRIDCGLRYNRKGYNEIHSRIGRRFFELEPTSGNDVSAICRANGLTDRNLVANVITSTEKSEFDLRCVKDAVHREKRIAAANSAKTCSNAG